MTGRWLTERELSELIRLSGRERVLALFDRAISARRAELAV